MVGRRTVFCEKLVRTQLERFANSTPGGIICLICSTHPSTCESRILIRIGRSNTNRTTILMRIGRIVIRTCRIGRAHDEAVDAAVMTQDVPPDMTFWSRLTVGAIDRFWNCNPGRPADKKCKCNTPGVQGGVQGVECGVWGVGCFVGVLTF